MCMVLGTIDLGQKHPLVQTCIQNEVQAITEFAPELVKAFQSRNPMLVSEMKQNFFQA